MPTKPKLPINPVFDAPTQRALKQAQLWLEKVYEELAELKRRVRVLEEGP
jgi:hypothetical protein